jgi:hypothetical protein
MSMSGNNKNEMLKFLDVIRNAEAEKDNTAKYSEEITTLRNKNNIK